MSRQSYFLIRIYDDQGKELTTRCEKADGPREACQKAFGCIYDQKYNTARYLNIGTRKPAYISATRLHEMKKDGPHWLPIPTSGK